MYLVVGLGNTGRQYESTRHNMGFDTVDYLVEEYKVPQGGVKFNAMYGKTVIGGEKVILMKPLSFMNLSGGPVRDMVNYFKAKPKGWDLADYVLGRFSTEDRKIVDEAIAKAGKAVDIMISQGPDAAMNEFNKKVKAVV